MNEKKPLTRLERAQTLVRQAHRLHRLIELRAPEFIIESARMSVAKTVIRFPVSEEQVHLHEQIDADMWIAEQEHLHKTGYYKDIEGDTNV